MGWWWACFKVGDRASSGFDRFYSTRGAARQISFGTDDVNLDMKILTSPHFLEGLRSSVDLRDPRT